jgi:beta-lactamase class A
MRTGWPTVRGAAAVLAATALLAACHPQPHSFTTPFARPAQQPGGTPTVSAPVVAAPSARTVVTRKLAAIAQRLPAGAISVAVRNPVTGATFSYGEAGGMWTGSVYKLLVLEALLLRSQRTGSWLSDYEIADITAMIVKSKNTAGYQMYLDAGGSTALAATARRLGLQHTSIGRSDPALTTSDARDGLTLLQHLVTDGPLDAHSRAFALGLMRGVQADQRWGVGVVADSGTTFANKNGWMRVGNTNGPGEQDNRRWLVNSLGVVRVDGQRLLISIFTKHNPDRDTGIDLVQRLVRVITPAVAKT